MSSGVVACQSLAADYGAVEPEEGQRGNVSEHHICESDALVDLFGHWLTSSEPDPLTVSH